MEPNTNARVRISARARLFFFQISQSILFTFWLFSNNQSKKRDYNHNNNNSPGQMRFGQKWRKMVRSMERETENRKSEYEQISKFYQFSQFFLCFLSFWRFFNDLFLKCVMDWLNLFEHVCIHYYIVVDMVFVVIGTRSRAIGINRASANEWIVFVCDAWTSFSHSAITKLLLICVNELSYS